MAVPSDPHVVDVLAAVEATRRPPGERGAGPSVSRFEVLDAHAAKSVRCTSATPRCQPLIEVASVVHHRSAQLYVCWTVTCEPALFEGRFGGAYVMRGWASAKSPWARRRFVARHRLCMLLRGAIRRNGATLAIPLGDVANTIGRFDGRLCSMIFRRARSVWRG